VFGYDLNSGVISIYSDIFGYKNLKWFIKWLSAFILIDFAIGVAYNSYVLSAGSELDNCMPGYY
jgi:hypothetical protein